MIGDAGKFWGLSIALALCALTANAGPCFSRTDNPAPVIVLAAAPARHVVKAGETVAVLAQRYGVPVAAILKANPGLNPAKLQLGREIVIPAGGRPLPAGVPSSSSSSSAPENQVSSGVVLRPSQAPQATPPLVSHDLPDAAKSAGALPSPTIGAGNAATVEETPGHALPAGESARAESALNAPATTSDAPPVPVNAEAPDNGREAVRVATEGRTIFSEQIVSWGLSPDGRLLAAVAIFVVGLGVSAWIASCLARTLMARGVPPQEAAVVRNLSRYGLYVAVLIAALGQLGFNTGALLALLGTAGLAVALALKEVLSNLAAGLVLPLLHLVRVGDRIRVTGVDGAAGIVESIGRYNASVRSDAGERIVIPNAKIVGSVIVVSRSESAGNDPDA